MSIKISETLKDYLKENTHVKVVYFNADGDYTPNVYKENSKLYTRLIDPAFNYTDAQKKHLEVVLSLSRTQVLGVEQEEAEEEVQEPAKAEAVPEKKSWFKKILKAAVNGVISEDSNK